MIFNEHFFCAPRTRQVWFLLCRIRTIYALVLGLTGTLLKLNMLRARKNGLIDNTLTTTEIQHISLHSVLPSAVFMISILVLIIKMQIADYSWLIIIPAKIMIQEVSKF